MSAGRGLLAAVLFLAQPTTIGGNHEVCTPGIINAPKLNGGPADLAVASAEECRALCEDHELCGAFTMMSRVHDGCFVQNGMFSYDNSTHANEPPLWPAAQCTLLAALAATVKPHPDKKNCSCSGVPRPACPIASAPQPCTEICPAEKLTGSRGVTCGRRRGFTHPLDGIVASPSATHCEGLCTARDDCLAWSWTGCGDGSPATCWLKNLVGRIEDEVTSPVDGKSFSCTGTKKYDAPTKDLARHGRNDSLAQLSAAPNNFTTWGYLQNPYHRVRHHSGMWRAHDRLNGFTVYPGSSVSKDPLSPNAGATLLMLGRSPSDGKVLLTAEEFLRAGVPRTSPLHTKSRIAMATGTIQATYYQASENVLAAAVQADASLRDGGGRGGEQYVALHLDTGAGARKGGDGRTGNGEGTFTAAIVGHAVIITGTGGPAPGAWGLSTDSSHHISTSFFASEAELHAAMDAGSALPARANYTTNSTTLFVVLGFAASTPLKLTAYLARSAPEVCSNAGCPDQAQAVLDNLATAQQGEAQNQLNRHIAEDNAFWQQMLKLEGSWPEEWKRGLQYDLNSVRANIRPATGVFLHPWDDMQVHGGRIVVAESSMDAMTLSYADMALAKDVLYGLYHDSAVRGLPNIPCQNEDGTPNMECMDGYTAGTPPSWGLPLFTVYSMFHRDGDKAWLGQMYPLLSSYLDFWLANRTDSGGYQIAMCSWESGQDNGRRWGWADPENVDGIPGALGGNGVIGGQVYGGDRSTRSIRAPEHQAAMAYSAGVMADFAKVLDKPDDIPKWRSVVDKHVNLTNSLYSKDHNWWCDYNSIAKVWQTGCNDNGPESGVNGAGKEIMQMAPLFFHTPALGVDLLSGGPGGVGTPALAELLTAVSDPRKMGTGPGKPIPGGKFRNGVWSSGGGSTWGPQPFLSIALAGNLNQTAVASGTTKRLVDAVWATIDARKRIHYGNSQPSGVSDRGSDGSPYPGVSYECWQLNTTNSTSGQPVPALATSCGAEDYSWTTEATTVNVIREVIGFREHHSFDASAFVLRPALPREWIEPGAGAAVYSVRDLSWRNVSLDIHFTTQASGEDMLLDVMVEESAVTAADGSRQPRRVAFSVINAEEEVHIRVLEEAFLVERQQQLAIRERATALKHDDSQAWSKTEESNPPPHILSIIVDDLGWYDSQIHNPDSFMTGNMGHLKQQGITLMRHHTYFYCSPTRRSFLSGRLPVHITGYQAGMCTNYLPLKFTLLPEKLKQADYETHMIGKGHLGYTTTDHLPANRGFDSHVGYLGGAENYHWGNAFEDDHCSATAATCQKDMWLNQVPATSIVDDIYYSANYYTSTAVQKIAQRNTSKPFYLHLTYQNVHSPFEEPPSWLQIPNGSNFWDQTYGSMLNAVDSGIGNVTKALVKEGMWDSTLETMVGSAWIHGIQLRLQQDLATTGLFTAASAPRGKVVHARPR